MKFNNVDVTRIEMGPFYKLDKEWALLTAGNEQKFNAMTVSWGFFGTMWNKPAATVFSRPSRYTKVFLEREDHFSLSFFDDSYKKLLGYFGSVSGRDEDKVTKSGLTPLFEEECGAPYFGEASLVLICKRLYCGDLKESGFLDKGLIAENYPSRDFHSFYIGEVIKAYRSK